MAGLLEIFPKLHAQETDATAQPTFGVINIGGSGTQTSSILLKTDKTSIVVGEKFKVKVEIKTNDVNINEYRLIIDFDPTKLLVIDADTTSTGTQVKNLDTIFVPADTQLDNSVSSAGRIRFNAKTTSGNSFSVNREVIEIEFQAQATGTTPIRIITGSTGSQLVRQNGLAVTYTSNELSILVNTASSNNTNTNTGGTNVDNVTTIPNTALPSGVAEISVLVIGVLLISVGTKLSLENKKKRTR